MLPRAEMGGSRLMFGPYLIAFEVTAAADHRGYEP